MVGGLLVGEWRSICGSANKQVYDLDILSKWPSGERWGT